MTTVPAVDDFERLGVFYLGRKYNLATASLEADLLLYDSKDLCTHALCVGMTGSGKTGLCLAMLEEAAIDNIPVLCVDPKGDLANLLLTFPDLRAEDFQPWLEAGEATRQGKTIEELAKDTAKRWSEGLAKWGQDGERIRRFRDSTDIAVYTPGSSAGLPLTVLRSFDAPLPQILSDSDAMRERISGAASGLLTLLGVEADPLLSREHILVSTILDKYWREGRSVSIGDLIGFIQSPPIERVGVMDLNSFMPAEARGALAMRLNNLLASPAFATWLEGESLSIQNLLYDSAGKPKISILSIAHLSDSERMFFVTILLNELVSWMRMQSGTSSLRALFYMDEIYGYFPPSAKPPSKAPMMTLLKQARAFGLGITLATQNPVDLDYKGLSNIGTWFLGRLQTERDKMRVLDGLEGVAVQSGQAFNRQQMEQTLAALGNRVFLMNNVHDDQPTLFQTRWALSFLAGPLGRDAISRLMKDRKEQPASTPPLQKNVHISSKPAVPSRPVVPIGVKEAFVDPRENFMQLSESMDVKRIYRPAVYGEASLHFVKEIASVDLWRDDRRFIDCTSEVPKQLWEESQALDVSWRMSKSPRDGFLFAELPTALCSADNFKRWCKDYKEFLYRHQTLVIYKSPALKQYAPGGNTIAEAQMSLTQLAREARDRETEIIRAKYTAKMETLDRRIRAAQEKLAKEEQQFKEVSVSSVVDLGQSILGALLGNKRRSRSSASKAGAIVRNASKAAQEREDVTRAEDSLKSLSVDMLDLDNALRAELKQIANRYSPENLILEETTLPPRKSDMRINDPYIVWTPWQINAEGIAQPLF